MMPDKQNPKGPEDRQAESSTPEKQDKVGKILSGIHSKDKKTNISGPTMGYVPSASEFEAEWERKIREAKKAEKKLITETPVVKKKPESLQEVFSQLKEAEAPVEERVKPEESKGRLGKIGGAVRGEIPKIKERELMGQGVPGLYRAYVLGGIPPFNLLSKVLYSMTKSSLERDLKKANIPLYADEYAQFSVAFGFIFSLLIAFLIFLVKFNLVYSLLAFFLSLLLMSLFLVNTPSLQVQSGSREVDRQLPFALRHMSALLKAGISIFDSMVSVSKAEYGTLSTELDKVIWDVKSGENLSEALEEASERINSHSFTRVTIHIKRALQMGGDVARIITQIADDLTFEMRMKISDFVEKLNMFAMVYLIGGIVFPVILAVFSIVGTAQLLGTGSAMVDSNTLVFMVLIIFPLIMAVIAYLVKIMEPKV